MALRIGDIAPDFTIDTTKGPIRFHEWASDRRVFRVSQPADCTPVRTTEIGRTAQRAEQLAKRNVKTAWSFDRFSPGWQEVRPCLHFMGINAS